jgi:hypothetical protein
MCFMIILLSLMPTFSLLCLSLTRSSLAVSGVMRLYFILSPTICHRAQVINFNISAHQNIFFLLSNLCAGVLVREQKRQNRQ